MEVVIQPDHESACLLCARLIADALRAKPTLVLGLATGRTMERVYQLLAHWCFFDGLDFSLARTFNLDEYVGLGPDDPRSYRYYMNRNLFDKVNIDLRNTHVLHGLADDLEQECARYEALIAEHGGIELQLLGIGRTGHIGFNEPLSAMLSRTRPKALTLATRQQNAFLFGGVDEVPARALTMGVGTILDARRCLLLATGEEKAEVVAQAVEGPVTSMISASALQLHPHCRVILDEPAASRLVGREYYDFIYEHEPEWAPYR